jgi:hypothetical protein
MLFVTNYTGYQLLARPDKTKLMPHPNGPDWGTISVVVQEPIMLEFRPKGILTFAQRTAAQEFFDPPAIDGHRPGPYRQAGVAGDPDFEGQTFEASDHWLFYSTFNTETDCPVVADLSPEEVQELAERILLSCAQLGTDYIRADEAKVAIPWPEYEETHHKSIATVVKAMGRDPRLVIEYEKTRAEPRPGVIADLEKLITAQAVDAANEEELTVRG